jgi:TRAP-type C4-dicarboxylate transport system substrate-binding protein
VEKRTNGKVKVTYFSGGTLIPAIQAYDGVINGITDIGMHTQQYTTGRFPLTKVMCLPIIAQDVPKNDSILSKDIKFEIMLPHKLQIILS